MTTINVGGVKVLKNPDGTMYVPYDAATPTSAGIEGIGKVLTVPERYFEYGDRVSGLGEQGKRLTDMLASANKERSAPYASQADRLELMQRAASGRLGRKELLSMRPGGVLEDFRPEPTVAELQGKINADRAASAFNASSGSRRMYGDLRDSLAAGAQVSEQGRGAVAAMRSQEQNDARKELIGSLLARSQLANEQSKSQVQNRLGALSSIGEIATTEEALRMQDADFRRNLGMAQRQLFMNAVADANDRNLNYWLRQRGLDATAGRERNARNNALLGSGISGISSLMSMLALMSDENTKTNIEPAAEKLYSFLDTIGAHEYDYKNKDHGDKRYVSPMAQELEKTELGKGMVIDTPNGKMVHYGRGLGVILSAQKSLHERLKALEAQR